MKKKLVYLLLAFNLLSYGAFSQDLSKCKLLIDGVLTDSVNCWEFKTMRAIFPLKEEWKTFDYLEARIYLLQDGIKQQKKTLVIGFKKNEMENYFKDAEYLSVVMWANGEIKTLPLAWHSCGFAEYDTSDCFPIFKIQTNSYVCGGNPNTRYDYRNILTDIKDTVLPAKQFLFELDGFNIKEFIEIGYDYPKREKQPLYTSKKLLFRYVSAPFKTMLTETSESINTFEACACSSKKTYANLEPVQTHNWKPDVEIIRKEKDAFITKMDSTGNECDSVFEYCVVSKSIVMEQSMLKELDKTKPYYFQQSGICWDSEKKEIFFDDTRWEEGYAKPDINGGKLYNGEVRHYYQKKRRIARGKVASVTLYKNGIKNGLCMRFKKNGKLNWAVEYKNGVIMRVLYKK